MIQQVQQRCDVCGGTGETIMDEYRCKKCNAKKVINERKILEVFIDKGMRWGEKITFPGEGDQAPDTVAGDVVLVLSEKHHSIFQRKGNDLFMTHNLTLVEALCGFEFVLQHLDGRQLVIKSEQNEIIKPGDVRGIEHQGMPLKESPYEFGNLYVKFEVEFPKKGQINSKNFNTLREILPNPKTPKHKLKQTDIVVELKEIQQNSKKSQRSQHTYYSQQDSDDERSTGCKQM
eukprot:Anaeramoba_ignava/c20919_g2_i1.p1 GENE.c20919_g2_i1~~c20919_g2_i1.p1  ORF type:complete len:232 (-),score=84.94 c20919_g2_i1:118-813(-)